MLKKLVFFLAFICLAASPLASQAAAADLMAFVRDGNIWVAASDGSGSHELTTSGRAGSPALSWDG